MCTSARWMQLRLRFPWMRSGSNLAHLRGRCQLVHPRKYRRLTSDLFEPIDGDASPRSRSSSSSSSSSSAGLANAPQAAAHRVALSSASASQVSRAPGKARSNRMQAPTGGVIIVQNATDRCNSWFVNDTQHARVSARRLGFPRLGDERQERQPRCLKRDVSMYNPLAASLAPHIHSFRCGEPFEGASCAQCPSRPLRDKRAPYP